MCVRVGVYGMSVTAFRPAVWMCQNKIHKGERVYLERLLLLFALLDEHQQQSGAHVVVVAKVRVGRQLSEQRMQRADVHLEQQRHRHHHLAT